MCGRFVRTSPVSLIAERFRIGLPPDFPEPSCNIAPTQEILIINRQGAKQFVACRWGFLPSWAKAPSPEQSLINARAETIATKPAFREAFRQQRCLVIADGFYEWQKVKGRKIPVYIHLRSGGPFGLAGIYSRWHSPEGEDICTCAIITTGANDLLAPIHDRMPVILPRDKEDLWLDPRQDPDVLLEMLRPYPSEELEYYEVSPKVNTPAYDSPDAINPI
ncbi:MAG: SOS response-associated peptidase [Thermodesulfovibrionales bacterium]